MLGWLLGSLAATIYPPVDRSQPTFHVLSMREHQRDQIVGITLADGSKMEVLCRDYRRDEVRLVARPSSPPGYLIRCNSESTGERKLVIWYHGGPWAFAGENLVLEQLAFLEAGYDIFVPFYPGSSDRPFEVERKRMTPDVIDAVAEAKNIHSWAIASYKTIDVVGESFGAYLAASLSRELASTGGVLHLINPSLIGESLIQRLYIQEGDRLQMNDLIGDSARRQARKMTHIYFRRSGNYDPFRELHATPTLKLKMVYGGTDPLISKLEISRLKMMIKLPCALEFRPNNGHEFGHTDQQLQGFRRLLACGKGLR